MGSPTRIRFSDLSLRVFIDEVGVLAEPMKFGMSRGRGSRDIRAGRSRVDRHHSPRTEG